ncbi:glycosyltransferase family 92 protein [Aquamicrobium segne]|uniref:Glycosyltransferase family 92 protein n=1 Tax=Aquamicrobium segne TaxID=469547 RepID=A0ABW0GV73_9HYPH
MLFFKKKPPFSKQLRITPPVPQANRHGVAVVTMLKDEETYIDEWLIFHQAAGIQHFIIYNDGSTDQTENIIKARLSPNELTLVPWAGRLVDLAAGTQLNSQVLAVAHAIHNFGSAFRWMAFIDVDEFLLPKHGNTIEEALEPVNGFPNVSLPWHMFGTGGHTKRPQGGVLRNYTMRAAKPIGTKKNITNFKCIFNPCAVSEVSVHHFETQQYGSKTCNDAGKVFARKERINPAFYSADNLQLNHYYTKSLEEFEAKIRKGPVSPGTHSMDEKRLQEVLEKRLRTALENIESDLVEDNQIVDFIDKNQIFNI